MHNDVQVEQDIMCMSNVRGRKIRIQKNIPFSFYFSTSQGQHDIQVKPMFDPFKLSDDKVGTLKLCDDWEYVPGKDDTHVSAKDVARMKKFFRTYLVLFAAVWDRQLDEGTLYDYLVGDITLAELVEEFEFYADYQEELDDISSVSELESFCRSNDLINMYGN